MFFNKEDIGEVPEGLAKELKRISNNSDWKDSLKDDNPIGRRHDKSLKIIGKLLHHLPQKDWDTVGWELAKSYDLTHNKPSLIEKYGEEDLKKKWEGIKMKESEKRDEKEEQKGNLATMLIELVKENKLIEELFADQYESSYAKIKLADHFEIMKIQSGRFKSLLHKTFYDQFKKPINQEAVNNALMFFDSEAKYSGNQYDLEVRVAKLNDDFWYDLTDKKHRAIKYSSFGWEMVENPPVLFSKQRHQKAQLEPSKDGDIKKLLKFVNVKDKKDEILILVWVVAAFISGFPHPILNLYGSQGSAKSTLLRLLKRLIDPSLIELTPLKKDGAELAQLLSHHWVIMFDNLSELPDACSDMLCRAVSGYGFSKRELYTNDDDIIYNIRRTIGINGINLTANKPDLLERSILIELERISTEKRKQESEIDKEFLRDLPGILGGIFVTLVKAININPTIAIKASHRMADFTVLGCAIAEALGYKKEEFLEAYGVNIEGQTDLILEQSLVGQALTKFLEDKDKWNGTASDLKKELEKVCNELNIDIRDQEWPKGANKLSEELQRLKNSFAEVGIKIFRLQGRKRSISIWKEEESIVTTVAIVNNDNTNDDDGDDCNDTNRVSEEEVPDSILRLQKIKEWMNKEIKDASDSN